MRGDLIAVALAMIGSGGTEFYAPPRTKRRRPFPREDVHKQVCLKPPPSSEITQAKNNAKQARKAAFRLKQRNTDES